MNSLPGKSLDNFKSRDEKIGYRIKNVMVVPLQSNIRIIGVISADNKKKAHSTRPT